MARFATAEPNPRGELEHVDPYTLLVAVVLSAQATDRSVNLATAELFKVASTPAAMVALGEERLIGYIRTIGLFRTKARNVIALSRRLVEEHGGVTPQSRAVLESLPGVGSKSASVVLNIAFGEPTIAVDTHVFRVSHRIAIAPGRTPDEVQAGLERRVPERFLLNAHHWLILHGRYTCKARVPECPRCLIRDLCRYPAKTPLGSRLPIEHADPRTGTLERQGASDSAATRSEPAPSPQIATAKRRVRPRSPP